MTKIGPMRISRPSVPSLANGGISKDGKTIAFTLRRGVTWSDGAPFSGGRRRLHDARDRQSRERRSLQDEPRLDRRRRSTRCGRGRLPAEPALRGLHGPPVLERRRLHHAEASARNATRYRARDLQRIADRPRTLQRAFVGAQRRRHARGKYELSPRTAEARPDRLLARHGLADDPDVAAHGGARPRLPDAGLPVRGRKRDPGLSRRRGRRRHVHSSSG